MPWGMTHPQVVKTCPPGSLHPSLLGSRVRPGGSRSPISGRFSALCDGCGASHPLTAEAPVSPKGCCRRRPSGLFSYSASHFWPIFCWIFGSLASSLTSQVSVPPPFSKPPRALALWLTPPAVLNGEGTAPQATCLAVTTTPPVKKLTIAPFSNVVLVLSVVAKIVVSAAGLPVFHCLLSHLPCV